MAPRNTKGKEFMLQQLYEVENVPDDLRGTDEFTNLSINKILKRIEATKKTPSPAPPTESDDGHYRAWSAFRG